MSFPLTLFLKGKEAGLTVIKVKLRIRMYYKKNLHRIINKNFQIRKSCNLDWMIVDAVSWI